MDRRPALIVCSSSFACPPPPPKTRRKKCTCFSWRATSNFWTTCPRKQVFFEGEGLGLRAERAVYPDWPSADVAVADVAAAAEAGAVTGSVTGGL